MPHSVRDGQQVPGPLPRRWRRLLTTIVHLSGVSVTLALAVNALRLSFADRLAWYFEPAEMCAFALDVPEQLTYPDRLAGRSGCQVRVGTDERLFVPLQPEWWPRVVALCLGLGVLAVAACLGALLVRHSEVRRKYRIAAVLVAVAIVLGVGSTIVTGRSTAWEEAHPDWVDAVAAQRVREALG